MWPSLAKIWYTELKLLCGNLCGRPSPAIPNHIIRPVSRPVYKNREINFKYMRYKSYHLILIINDRVILLRNLWRCDTWFHSKHLHTFYFNLTWLVKHLPGTIYIPILDSSLVSISSGSPEPLTLLVSCCTIKPKSFTPVLEYCWANRLFFFPCLGTDWFNKNTNNLMMMIDWFLVFNATFSSISAISWQPVLVVEEAGVPGENHRPWASNW